EAVRAAPRCRPPRRSRNNHWRGWCRSESAMPRAWSSTRASRSRGRSDRPKPNPPSRAPRPRLRSAVEQRQAKPKSPADPNFRSHDRSRHALEPREVRLALLVVSVAAFLRLFGHVIEQGGISSQFLDSRHAVHLGIECRLEAAEKSEAITEDLAGPMGARLFEFRPCNIHGNQPQVEGFGRAIALE